MSAIKILQAFGRKIAAKKSKTPEGITQIQPQIYAESEAGAIASTLQDAGIPLSRLDEFIRSEQDLIRILNQIESSRQTRVIPHDSPEGREISERLFGKKGEVVDMEGKTIPPGSRIMGGKAVEEEKTNPRFLEYAIKRIKSMEPINAMKEANLVIGRKGDYKNLTKEDAKKILNETEDHIFERNVPRSEFDPPDEFAKGGIARLGFKVGGIDKARRAFLKILGAGAAGVGALKTGLLKLGGKQAVKEVVKTAPAPGKPEWFDTLVNKVITEGDDVTKQVATLDRTIVHRYKLDTDETVDVTQYLDSGDIKVSYDSPNNMAGEYVDLNYKAPEMLEEGKVVPADFKAIEAEPRGVRSGPDDYDIEFDGENIVENVDELMSDTNKLKSLGGKNPSMREILEGTKKKKRVQAINEDQVEQAEYLDTKYGPAPDDYASGGIARMLGE